MLFTTKPNRQQISSLPAITVRLKGNCVSDYVSIPGEIYSNLPKDMPLTNLTARVSLVRFKCAKCSNWGSFHLCIHSYRPTKLIDVNLPLLVCLKNTDFSLSSPDIIHYSTLNSGEKNIVYLLLKSNAVYEEFKTFDLPQANDKLWPVWNRYSKSGMIAFEDWFGKYTTQTTIMWLDGEIDQSLRNIAHYWNRDCDKCLQEWELIFGWEDGETKKEYEVFYQDKNEKKQLMVISSGVTRYVGIGDLFSIPQHILDENRADVNDTLLNRGLCLVTSPVGCVLEGSGIPEYKECECRQS